MEALKYHQTFGIFLVCIVSICIKFIISLAIIPLTVVTSHLNVLKFLDPHLFQ